jgi:hypothetical protein
MRLSLSVLQSDSDRLLSHSVPVQKVALLHKYLESMAPLSPRSVTLPCTFGAIFYSSLRMQHSEQNYVFHIPTVPSNSIALVMPTLPFGGLSFHATFAYIVAQ